MSLFVTFTNAHDGQEVRVDADKISLIQTDDVETGKTREVHGEYASGMEYKKDVPVTKLATKLTLDFAKQGYKTHQGSVPSSFAAVHVVEEPQVVQARIDTAYLEREIQLHRVASQMGVKL